MIKHPKFPRANIYLSGGMQHAKDLGGAWRTKCSGVLKRLEYFPLDITQLDIQYTKEFGELYLVWCRSSASSSNEIKYSQAFCLHRS